MIGLAVTARPMVLLLLTDKWESCIPYLQLLCFVGFWYPLHLVNLNALIALGRSDLFFRLELIKKVLTLLNIGITYRWGVEAMIYGQIVNGILAFLLHCYYTSRYVGYSMGHQLRDLGPYLGIAGLMGLAVASIGGILPLGPSGQLGARISLGIIIYALICRWLRLSALAEVISTVHNKIRPAR